VDMPLRRNVCSIELRSCSIGSSLVEEMSLATVVATVADGLSLVMMSVSIVSLFQQALGPVELPGS